MPKMVVQRGLASWPSELTEVQREMIHSNHELHYDSTTALGTSVQLEQTTLPAHNCVLPEIPVQEIPNDENVVEWRNTFNMRQVILSNLSNSQMGSRLTFRPHTHLPMNRIRGRCITSAAKSLDILRLNIQAAVNKELDLVIKKYLEKFFQPAVDNIRNNLGAGSVTEDHIREVCRQILEDAKQMYCSGPQSRGSSPSNELSDSETGSISDHRFGRPATRSPLLRRRKESDTDSETSQSARRKRSKTRLPSGLCDRTIPIKIPKSDSSRSEGSKLDPSRILKETLFVMGARANKVLGFGQTRGRLYMKHPGLLRYTGDQEDKEWLLRHNLMSPTGGKAYIMILDDIRELAETEEYRNSPNLLLHELKGFEAPEFMLRKIRAFLSHMQTDTLDSKKLMPVDFCDNSQTNFAMIHGRFSLGNDCVSSAMTPPATVLDSGPPTPSDALDLLDCPTLASQGSDSSPGPVRTLDSSPSLPLQQQIAGYSSTLSALLAGHVGGDSSQGGLE
ncbi:deoxynucleotidyltransferase terminal-interacting protein 1 [Schistocerca americana]|uniref:deoxynucleotidyltransferase terminal-interacting protein 1 n=1 Tax=Schistocerca americana TaxID=7009 RepID=UPI001F502D73|nr:deoxynucleotidyltransferase terminal-interacting protein 1 [Schistocerca americana]